MVDVDWLQPLPGAHPGIWRQQWIKNIQRKGLYGQNSSLGIIWCQWKRLWSQGHKISEKEQIKGYFWMLRWSEFRILKDKNWCPRKFSDSTVIFPRTNHTNCISYTGDCKAEHGDANPILRLGRQHPQFEGLGLSLTISFQNSVPFLILLLRRKSFGKRSTQSILEFACQFLIITNKTPYNAIHASLVRSEYLFLLPSRSVGLWVSYCPVVSISTPLKSSISFLYLKIIPPGSNLSCRTSQLFSNTA